MTLRIQKTAESFAPIALSVIYLWFGFIKIFEMNPTEPMVQEMLSMLFPWMSLSTFNIYFGIFEICIGLCFLIKRTRMIALMLMIPHMLGTLLPLILSPSLTWWQFPFPSFAGQYIIKNIALISLALLVYVHINTHHYERFKY